MPTFQLNGVELSSSSLTQRAYRAASCGFMVHVTPQNQSEALRAYVEGDYSGIHLSGVSDLSFLKDFPSLRYIEIADQKDVNTRPLDGLTNLRGLRLDTPGTGIDFSCFPHLEVFVGDWHGDNCNVHMSRELRQLRAWHFKPKSGNLEDIANTTRLEWLALTQTSITSLEGLETLDDLRYLELAYAPKLESIEVFEENDLEIREIELQNAKRIATYEPLASFRRLRRLKISNCAPMPDLKWTNGMSNLDFLSFVETNVEDGDLLPLLKLPALRYVGTENKRHYSHKMEYLNELLEVNEPR